MRGVMGPNAGPAGQVKAPEDLPIFDGIEAKSFATIADQINPVVLDGYGRSNATLGPIEINILVALGHDQLPEETACGFFETHQHAAITLLLRIARVAIICADVNAATGDNGRGVSLGAEFRGPFDVLASFGVEGSRHVALPRNHVARPGLSPLGLVGGQKLKGRRSNNQGPKKIQAPRSERPISCGEFLVLGAWIFSGAWLLVL